MQVEVKNLTKKYGNTTVLDSINFEIGRGEIIGFLGPNGAGKTTTMRILTGFLAPTSGQVNVTELDILAHPIEVKRKIGYLPENNPLYNEMKVFEYLEFMARAKGLPRVEEELKRVLRVCGLRDRVEQAIGELSKGYRQRVGLAQALLGDPEIIILDEPTSGLDPNQIAEIRNLIKEIGKTKTVILSTHILPEVQASCTRALIIHKGKIVASGTTQELILQAEKKAQMLLAVSEKNENFEQRLRETPGVHKVSLRDNTSGSPEYLIEASEGKDPRIDIFRLCADMNNPILGMEYKTMSLEDVFRQLTKEVTSNP